MTVPGLVVLLAVPELPAFAPLLHTENCADQGIPVWERTHFSQNRHFFWKLLNLEAERLAETINCPSARIHVVKLGVDEVGAF